MLKRRATKYIRFQDNLNGQLSKEMEAIYVQTHKLSCPVCESEWRKIGKSKQTRAAKKAIREELKQV